MSNESQAFAQASNDVEENKEFKSGLLDDGKSFNLESLVAKPAVDSKLNSIEPIDRVQESLSTEQVYVVGNSLHIKEEIVENAFKKSKGYAKFTLPAAVLSLVSIVGTFSIVGMSEPANALALVGALGFFASTTFLAIASMHTHEKARETRVDGEYFSEEFLNTLVARVKLRTFKLAKKKPGESISAIFDRGNEVDGVDTTVRYNKDSGEYVIKLSQVPRSNDHQLTDNAIREFTQG